MLHKKPPDISDEEWDNTPQAVRELLSHSLEQIKILTPHSTIVKDSITNTPLPKDDGSTFFMPSAPDDEDDIMAMPVETPSEDEGSTFFMPTAPTLDDEGGTMAMPVETPSEDEGSTFFMPTIPVLDDEGGTMAMPMEDIDIEGGTIAIPTSIEMDEGRTAFIPSTMPVNSNDGATLSTPPTDTKENIAAATVIANDIDKIESKAPVIDELWKKNVVLQGRYRLRRILGQGGFGAAYLAKDVTLERDCVVKQMLSPANISPKELKLHQASFTREAKLLADLNVPGHPNIPEIFDYFTDENSSYLVMKYIEGQSLRGLVETQDIPWREAVRYMSDVSSALNYMHTQGQEPVMHRDIKPDNILLGDDGRIWLVDFGLAQAKPVGASGNLSSEQQAAGSVGYTPFEQWVGETVPASDVYANGVTLHYLVTDLSPLEAYRDEDGKMRVNIEKLQMLHSQLDPIRKIKKGLPAELEEIISAATSSHPEQRFTALQLQQQLDVLISGASDAALFTFKNGVSAYTIPELVDLCEQNRVEAQGYLYRGDFERWFTLINRNDLAEAATKAVKQGQDKDGLERFLKLIMPNIFWRRLRKAGVRIAKVGTQLLVILIIAMLLAMIVGTIAGRWIIQRTIAGYDWDYYTLEIDQDNVFPEEYLTKNSQEVAQLFFENVKVDSQSPDQVIVSANLGGFIYLNTPLELQMVDNRPHVKLYQLNDTPLTFVGDYLSGGINNGIAEALESAPIEITNLVVDNEAIIVSAAKNERVVWNPPTPIPQLEPTATPTPIPTPTPRGLALLVVFNDLDRGIILNIEGESFVIPAQDIQVIEKLPGTYSYTATYAENGLLAAQGTKFWDHKAYKWRIGVDGETFE